MRKPKREALERHIASLDQCQDIADAGVGNDGDHECGRVKEHEMPHRCAGCAYEWSDSPGGSWAGTRREHKPNWFQRWLANH